jgi:uncharacterized protein YggE
LILVGNFEKELENFTLQNCKNIVILIKLFLMSNHLDSPQQNNQNNSGRNPFLNLSIIITLFSFLAITALIGASVVYFQYLKYRNDEKTSKIEVQGSAEKKVKYDKLTMSFTISKAGIDTVETNRLVDELSVKTLAILQKNGITKENIQNSKNSYPDYTDIYNPAGTGDSIKEKKTIFETRYVIKIEDLQTNLEAPNKITQELVAIGVDRFDSYQYEVINQKQICEELKTEAITNARNQGVKQIKAIGGKEIVSSQIQTGADNCGGLMFPIPYASSIDKVTLGPAADANLSPDVVTGEKTISQQIIVTFDYR